MAYRRISLRLQRLSGAFASVVGIAVSCYPSPHAVAEFNPFGNAPALSNEALSRQRGGFISPEGVRVAIGYTMETQVNGALVMRSHVTIDPRASTRMQNSAYQGTVTIASAVQPSPTNSSTQNNRNQSAVPTAYFVPQKPSQPGRQVFSIQRPGTTIQLADVRNAQNVEPTAPPSGSVTQTLESTNIALDTARFNSTLDTSGYQGHYQGPNIDVIHQVQGGVPSAVVSNTANNRLVDHRTIVNLDLSQVNLPPSATLRAVNAGIANGLRTFR